MPATEHPTPLLNHAIYQRMFKGCDNGYKDDDTYKVGWETDVDLTGFTQAQIDEYSLWLTRWKNWRVHQFTIVVNGKTHRFISARRLR